MKKIISLLTVISLTATTATSLVSCQAADKEDPLYKLPKMPQSIEETKELVGYYWDLHEFYKKEYFDNEAPKGIKGIDSDNYQKNALFLFFSADCLAFIAYQLGQRGGFRFETPQGNDCSIFETTKHLLDGSYQRFIDNSDIHTTKSKEQATKWYNWALTAPSITFQ